MTLPTIHINGTAKADLLDPLCDASIALDQACGALKLTAPNGRDYYTQGPDAINKAVDEHEDRLRRLYAIKHEIDVLAMVIDEGGASF